MGVNPRSLQAEGRGFDPPNLHDEGWREMDLVAELPTDINDEQTARHRANLARAKASWETMPVDDIIALYRQRVW